MRIAILQGAFLPIPPILGGAVEKMWFSLGNEFAQNGHEVVHISRSLSGLSNFEVIEGVQHIRVKGYDTPKSGFILKMLDLLYTIRVRKLFRENFDIIVSNTFWAPIVLPREARKACVVDVARMPKGQLSFYLQAARLRANSSSVASAIQHEIPAKYYKKIIMVPNPLPFIPSSGIDIKRKKPIILYTGRIHPEKGIDILIDAYRKTNQKYKLQIIGPWNVAAGGGGLAYLDFLKNKSKGTSIEFIDPVYETEQLNKYYADASIFIYPSIAEKGETFGLAPLEAMAWGCVPIVSDLPCFNDFIGNGTNGLVFDHRTQHATDQLAGQISDLQVNVSLRERLAQNALKVRESHSVSNIADAFLKEFKYIVVNKNQYGIN